MIKILFICHGNICRSVAAHYVMRELTEEEGLADQFVIDSAATSTEEIGNPIYPPMQKTLRAHGVTIGSHRARQMRKRDYEDFDLLVAMDSENLYYMNRMYGSGNANDSFWSRRGEEITPTDPEGKISLLMDYTDRPGEVADPWYTRDFEATYRDVVEGCRGLLEHLIQTGAVKK